MTLQADKPELTGYPSIDKPWLKYYDKSKESSVQSGITCYKQLRKVAKEHPNDLVLQYFNKKITYMELLNHIDKVAKAFSAIGVIEKDIVTVLAVNTPEVVYIFFALNKLGAISNFVDVRTNATGLKNYFIEASSKIVVTLDLCLKNVDDALAGTKIEKVVFYSATESMPAFVKVLKGRVKPKELKNEDKILSWSKFVGQAKKTKDSNSYDFCGDMPAVIVHTGGTTGIPKGVILSNDAFNAVVSQVDKTPFNFKRGDKFLNILVPFVAFGLTLGLYVPIISGWRTILVPKFSPSDIVGLMKKYKPQIIMGIQTYFEPLLDDNSIDYSNVKGMLMGGMPTKAEFEKAINEKIKSSGGKFIVSKGYSMTENSSTATCSYSVANKVGSNGIPLCDTIVSAFEPGTDKELAYGEKGEICICSPQHMSGYYNNPNETDEVMRVHKDGKVWIHTKDIGYVDEDGFVYVLDRIKRMIIRQGFKVFPSEIENTILMNEAVQCCAVVAQNNSVDDKVPVAFIVKNKEVATDDKEIEKEILILMERNGLPDYFRPYRFFFVDELPLTNIGKVDTMALEKLANDHIE